MAMTPTSVLIQVRLDSPGLLEAVESAIRTAYLEGLKGAPKLESMTPDEVYRDWRGWGPGVFLTGGHAYRLAAQAQQVETPVPAREVQDSPVQEDDVEVCVTHVAFRPCRHGGPDKPFGHCQYASDAEAVKITREYQESGVGFNAARVALQKRGESWVPRR